MAHRDFFLDGHDHRVENRIFMSRKLFISLQTVSLAF